MPETSDRCENFKKTRETASKLFIIVMVQVDYDSPPHLPGTSNGNSQAKDP